MAELLSVSDLPSDFEYPRQFVRVVELGLTRLEPWWIIEGALLRERRAGMKERYPSRTLVPFAVRQDRDDVACFAAGGDQVLIIHDFADAGFEQRGELPDFNGWLRCAIDDLIEFGA
jgi:hypothetical protein